MDTSILLARLIGPMFVAIGIGVLFNRAFYKAMMVEFLDSAGLYYFSGAAALIVGLVLVQFHNVWVADWRVIITMMGWVSLAKGAIRIVVPGAGAKFAARFAKSALPINAAVVFLVVIGLWLSLEGYRG